MFISSRLAASVLLNQEALVDIQVILAFAENVGAAVASFLIIS